MCNLLQFADQFPLRHSKNDINYFVKYTHAHKQRERERERERLTAAWVNISHGDKKSRAYI